MSSPLINLGGPPSARGQTMPGRSRRCNVRRAGGGQKTGNRRQRTEDRRTGRFAWPALCPLSSGPAFPIDGASHKAPSGRCRPGSAPRRAWNRPG